MAPSFVTLNATKDHPYDDDVPRVRLRYSNTRGQVVWANVTDPPNTSNWTAPRIKLRMGGTAAPVAPMSPGACFEQVMISDISREIFGYDHLPNHTWLNAFYEKDVAVEAFNLTLNDSVRETQRWKKCLRS